MRFITGLLGRFFVSGVALVMGLGLICLAVLIIGPVVFVAYAGWKILVGIFLL